MSAKAQSFDLDCDRTAEAARRVVEIFKQHHNRVPTPADRRAMAQALDTLLDGRPVVVIRSGGNLVWFTDLK